MRAHLEADGWTISSLRLASPALYALHAVRSGERAYITLSNPWIAEQGRCALDLVAAHSRAGWSLQLDLSEVLAQTPGALDLLLGALRRCAEKGPPALKVHGPGSVSDVGSSFLRDLFVLCARITVRLGRELDPALDDVALRLQLQLAAASLDADLDAVLPHIPEARREAILCKVLEAQGFETGSFVSVSPTPAVLDAAIARIRRVIEHGIAGNEENLARSWAAVGERGVAPLRELIDSPKCRNPWLLALTLAAIGAPAAGALRTLVDHPDERVRNVARQGQSG